MAEDLHHEHHLRHRLPHPAPEVQYHYDVAALQADATLVDLNAPFVHSPLFADEDYPENDERRARTAPEARGVKRERADDEAQDTGADEGRREHHNKHTRRCRARLKSKFDSLMATLPPPSSVRGEVKHKVQVLEYAMEVFESLDEELRLLEWNLALKSHKHLLKWIIAQEDPVQAFIDLFCSKFGFVYAEVWNRTTDSDTNNNNNTSSSISNSGNNNIGDNGVGYGDGAIRGSKIITENRSSGWVVDKFSCHQTSWVDDDTLSHIIVAAQKLVKHATVVYRDHITAIDDIDGGEAALYRPVQVAPNHGVHPSALRTCLLVPVFVMGDPAHIIALFDVRVNRVIPHRVTRLAAVLAANIGNIFANNQHQYNPNNNNGAHNTTANNNVVQMQAGNDNDNVIRTKKNTSARPKT